VRRYTRGRRYESLAGRKDESIAHLDIIASLIEWPYWCKELPATGLVGLSGNTADRDDRRAGLLGERGALDAGPHEDERPYRRVEPLTVDLEVWPPA